MRRPLPSLRTKVDHYDKEKLNEAVLMMNKNLQVCLSDHWSRRRDFKPKGAQEVNIQNMNVELVAQMFKNYQSNVLFHLEGRILSDTNGS